MSFQKRIEKLAAVPAAFWGQGYRIRINQNVPSLNWDEITVPVRLESSEDEELVCILLHEWGHRCIAPVTVATGYWWQILAKMEGIRLSADAANIAADLLVDRWYMTHPEWAGLYQKNFKSMLKEKLSKESEFHKTLEFLIACYIEMQQWHHEFPEFEIDHEYAGKAVKTLTNHKVPLTRCIREFMSLLALFLKDAPPEQADCVLSSRRSKGSGPITGPIHGQNKPWKGKRFNVDELVRIIKSESIFVPDQLLQEVCGTRLARQTFARLELLESLSRIMHKVNCFVKDRETRKPDGNTIWRIGHSVSHLQPVASIEKAGYLLPGVNTLRRRFFDRQNYHENLPTLILIVDNSASTTGKIIKNLLDAVVSLIEVARQCRGKVGLIVFGNDVVAEFAPGFNYNDIEYCLAGLYGQSGGTLLAESLSRAINFTKTGKDKYTTLIFTDSYIFDLNNCRQLLQKLKEKGELVFFCVENRLDNELITIIEELPDSPRLVRFRPGQPLVDAALEVLK